MLDLLPDLDELSVLLRSSLSGGLSPSLERNERMLDSFLLAGGMNQIVEDYLHRDVYALRKVASRLGAPGAPHAGRAAAACLRLVRAAGLGLRTRSSRQRDLVRWQASLAALVERLALEVAREVVSGEAPATGGRDGDDEQARAETDLLQVVRDALAPVDACPKPLRKAVVHLAHCFRSFDQRPVDCRLLARSFADRFPDRNRPVLVVGLRTSGGYLAPLQSVFLQLDGYANVGFLTLRPGQDLQSHELERIAATVRGHGVVCVVDDPPRTGAQLAAAAAALLAAGVPRRSLLLLVQVFGPAESLPARLREYESIVLPWERWSVHEMLCERAVRATLARLLRGRVIAVVTETGSRDVLVRAIDDVRRIEAAAANASPARGHVAAVFRARLVDEWSGGRVEHDVYVRGVGLGYLGRHSLAVASAVSDFVPQVYGVDSGFLYRAWFPESWRLAPPPPKEYAALADRIASYVAARRDGLAVDDDSSRRLSDRGAAWEIVADMMRDAFGRAKDVSRPLTNRAAVSLTKPTRASVVDGSMALSHWFAPPGNRANGALRKVDVDERAFSNEEVYCYDAAFDLACAAADYVAMSPTEPAALEFGDRLRARYERTTGDVITNERWLLYQLLYHRRLERGRYRPAARRAEEGEDPVGTNPGIEIFAGVTDSRATTRPFDRLLAGRQAMALAHQRYFADLFFADLVAPDSGPVCAIDLDWVLETRWLSFPAISYAGAAALRALHSHGCRAVIATGRSLAELRARCAAYRLAGGVAEYGAVAYSRRSGRVLTLLTPADRDELAVLRGILLDVPGVRLDLTYEYGIRAYRLDSQGEPSGLDEATVQDVLERTGAPERFRPIAAPSQTDFTLAHVDKGAGLRLLVEDLNGARTEPTAPVLAFAMGDSLEDVSMLTLAEHRFAPSNADARLREGSTARSLGLRVIPRPNQTGLLRAVTAFLGHSPRVCDVCALPRHLSNDTRIFLAALGAIEGAGREKIRQSVLLAATISNRKAAHRGTGM